MMQQCGGGISHLSLKCLKCLIAFVTCGISFSCTSREMCNCFQIWSSSSSSSRRGWWGSSTAGWWSSSSSPSSSSSSQLFFSSTTLRLRSLLSLSLWVGVRKHHLVYALLWFQIVTAWINMIVILLRFFNTMGILLRFLIL